MLHGRASPLFILPSCCPSILPDLPRFLQSHFDPIAFLGEPTPIAARILPRNSKLRSIRRRDSVGSIQLPSGRTPRPLPVLSTQRGSFLGLPERKEEDS